MGLRGVRINSAGCLDRCEKGPAVVVYPEGIWYSLSTKEDVDRVLTDHLEKGQWVEDLMMDRPKD